MARDKKNRAAGVTLILPTRIGEVGYAAADGAAVRAWLQQEARSAGG